MNSNLVKAEPRVVIVGAGFGGLQAAKCLGSSAVQVIVIDRVNHHLFQPLLYQVATATLSPADIASPIRSVLREQKNTEVIMAEVTGVDRPNKKLQTTIGFIHYDYLILATGARHSYFGKDEWEPFAPGLKSIPDATKIRQKILLAFEKAEMEPDAKKRSDFLHFILVGGGPTGVEMAGAIAELAHRALASDFRHIDPASTIVTIVEAGPRILSGFPEDLSQKAHQSLEELGVKIRVNTRVENINAQGVWIGNECLFSANVIWTAGVQASPAGTWLGAETDRAGRVKVKADLSLEGNPEIFIIGDTAAVFNSEGKPLPGIAPVAMQEGRYVASVINLRQGGRNEVSPFRYKDKGNLATVGRSFAIADIGNLHISGWVGWVTWLAVHIYYLIGFRNRFLVLFQWFFSYITFQRGARLIVPDSES